MWWWFWLAAAFTIFTNVLISDSLGFLIFSSFEICPFSLKTSLDAWYGICSQLHMCKKREMWFSWLSEHLGHVPQHCNTSARALKILSVWFLIEAKVGWWWKSPARQTWAAAQIWLEALGQFGKPLKHTRDRKRRHRNVKFYFVNV